MGNRQRQNWKTFWSLASTAIFLIPGAGAGALFAKSIMVGATNILINFLLPLRPSKQIDDSPSYSWKHEPNLSASSNLVMPIVYGQAKVKPVIKSRHIRLEGTKQYLDVLYSVTGHRIDERVPVANSTYSQWVPNHNYNINDEVTTPTGKINTVSYYEPGKTYICKKAHKSTSIPSFIDTSLWRIGHGTAWGAGLSGALIDGNPIESYETGIPNTFRFETRAGAAVQAFCEGFDTTYDNYPQGEVINYELPTICEKQAYISHFSALFRWNRHTLLYLGAPYEITRKTAATYSGSYPMYVLWTPSAPDTYTLSATKTVTGYFAVASFEKSSTFLAKLETPSVVWKIMDVTLSNIHDIELIFDFPQGLYAIDWETGNTIKNVATIHAHYREAGIYTSPTAGWNKFEQMGEWNDGGILITKGYYSDSMWSGGAMVVQANNTNNFSVSWKAKIDGFYLDTSKNYEIRVAAVSSCVVELANIAGVTYAKADVDDEYRPHTYPGESLIAIRAMATGYLKGGFELTVVAKRSAVKVYNPDTAIWEAKDATAHAWAVYDILVNGYSGHPFYPNMINAASVINPVYGCGVDPDRINYDSFVEWYAHAYTKLGYRLNTVFDTEMSAWDAVIRICEEGLAALVPIGSEFRVIVDRPALAAEIQSLFCMGNINEGAFQQSWVDRSKKARSIEVSFANAERNYEQTTFTVRISDWDTADEQDYPLSMPLYGTTGYHQALGIAQYRLNCNYLLSQTIAFQTDIEAMALDVGDVIPLQHDTICGAGGRLAAVDYNLIKNPSFEDGTGFTNWSVWGVPPYTRHQYTIPVVGGPATGACTGSGTKVYHHAGVVENVGSYQSGIALKAGKEYTISGYVWLVSTVTGGTGIRLQMLVDGVQQKALTDITLLDQWQRVSVTFTTVAATTNSVLVIGGHGECYFDAVMINQGATVCDFMLYNATTLTFDKAMTVTVGKLYELQIARKDGDIEKKENFPSTQLTADGLQIAFGSSWVWGYRPEVYDCYAFGEVGSAVKNFRIMSIEANSEYKFEITAMEYDATVYLTNPNDSGSGEWTAEKIATIAPDLGQPTLETFNRAISIVLQEIVSLNRTTGQYESSITVRFTPENGQLNGEWEVSWRDVDADDAQIEGIWETSTDGYNANDVVENEGVVYISAESENKSTPFLVD